MELNDAGPAVPVGGISDRELWARAVDGDREAFGRMFDRHGKTVYNHLFRRTADWSEAEDLTSTVFLHAWRRLSETVLDRDSALPWLLGIADGLLSNTRRRLRRAEALLRRLVSHDEPVGDHADRVAGLVDDERRMSLLWSVPGVQVRLPGDDQATPAAADVLLTVEPPDSGGLIGRHVGHELGDVDEVVVIFVGRVLS
ncbi:RNA polymerase sigma factor [Streptomyces mirabilis]|uniref:RNA polymerase sigma factor n=1 Tax=Streptomyces mirabilis TaxID=68239 RepID=UPI0033348970